MCVIAKLKPIASGEGTHELFEVVEAVGIDGNSVFIQQPIGDFSIERLEKCRLSIVKSLEEIDIKINAIANDVNQELQ